VDHRNEDQIAPLVKEQYIDKGRVEDYSDYITYNKTSNYGNEKGSSSGMGLGKDDE
jgi:hypothetical protein